MWERRFREVSLGLLSLTQPLENTEKREGKKEREMEAESERERERVFNTLIHFYTNLKCLGTLEASERHLRWHQSAFPIAR